MNGDSFQALVGYMVKIADSEIAVRIIAVRIIAVRIIAVCRKADGKKGPIYWESIRPIVHV